jgi:hypothetical protein
MLCVRRMKGDILDGPAVDTNDLEGAAHLLAGLGGGPGGGGLGGGGGAPVQPQVEIIDRPHQRTL